MTCQAWLGDTGCRCASPCIVGRTQRRQTPALSQVLFDVREHAGHPAHVTRPKRPPCRDIQNISLKECQQRPASFRELERRGVRRLLKRMGRCRSYKLLLRAPGNARARQCYECPAIRNCPSHNLGCKQHGCLSNQSITYGSIGLSNHRGSRRLKFGAEFLSIPTFSCASRVVT